MKLQSLDKMASNNLNTLLGILLKTYFFDSRCALVFTDPSTSLDLQPEIPTVRLTVQKTLNSQLIFQHHGCQDLIIFHENSSDLFVEFEKLIRFGSERFNKRKYLITGKNSLEVFKTKAVEYVSNILVVLPLNEEVFELFTHIYSRNEIEITTLDVWFSQNRTFLKGYHLFPDKFTNSRQLKIGTFTYEPYSVISADNQTVHGTESSFVFEFIKKYNLTPRFKIITGDDLWGDVYDNWTGFGILGSLVEDEVDIGYGAIYTWEAYYNFLDYSKPLTRTGVTVLVPSPKQAAGWLTPLFSFSFEMWIAVLLVLLSDTITLYFLLRKTQKGGYLETSLMIVVKLYLLQSLSKPLKGKIIKYFIALNMLNVLLLSSTYSSGLSSVMTVPRYERAIKTVNDLALSGLPWGAPTDAWLISIRDVNDSNYETIKNNFVVKSEENLIRASKSHNFGFSLERLPYGHYAVGPYIKGDVISNYQIMQQDIYWEHCIFVVRKNSVLLPMLDDLILRVFEAGLAAFWENEVVAQHMDMAVQRGIMYHTQEHSIIKLKWVHVEGAFAVLVIGCTTSVVISRHNSYLWQCKYFIRNLIEN